MHCVNLIIKSKIKKRKRKRKGPSTPFHNMHTKSTACSNTNSSLSITIKKLKQTNVSKTEKGISSDPLRKKKWCSPETNPEEIARFGIIPSYKKPFWS